MSRRCRPLARAAAAVAFCPLVVASPWKTAEAPDFQLRVALVLPGASADSAEFHRGAVLGAEESSRAAALLGHSLTLEVVRWEEGERLPDIGAAAAVLSAVDCSRLRVLADGVFPEGTAVLNIACVADSTRVAGCHPSIFHVVASEAMHAGAARLAEASTPGSARVAAFPGMAESAGRGGFIAGWHPELYRFGAEQLNDRYEARFGGGMSYQAWTAWMGVKIAWETAARSGGDRALAEQLRAGRHRFDGHKGVALDFRPWDHQLRQPLYHVTPAAAGEVRITDVPQRGSATVHLTLDQIGTGAADTRCAPIR